MYSKDQLCTGKGLVGAIQYSMPHTGVFARDWVGGAAKTMEALRDIGVYPRACGADAGSSLNHP